MRVESLTLRGLLSIADQVSIDLSAIPAGSLIAVRGDNGAGKTTIMEAVLGTLYRQFASRSSKELVDYATRSDAFIETRFALEGSGRFRARVTLDGPHRQSSAVLAQVDERGGEQLLSDGKVTTYDAAVARILPPLGQLTASVFAAQNREGSFIRLDRKGRRALFATLLGADRYEQWSERARQAGALTTQAIERLEARRDALLRDTSEALSRELHDLESRIRWDSTTLETRRGTLATELATAETTLAALQDDAAKYAAARTEADRLDTEIVRLKAEALRAADAVEAHRIEGEVERRTLAQRAQDALDRLRREAADTSAFTSESKRIAADLATAVADVQARAANNRKVIDAAEEIRAAVAAVQAADEQIAITRGEQERLVLALQEVQAKIVEISKRIHAAEASGQALTRAEQDAALLTRTPCHGAGDYATCEFLTQATKARADIPRLQEATADLAALRAEREALEQEAATIQAALKAASTWIATLTAERDKAQQLAKREPDLKAAQDRIKELVERGLQLRRDADAANARAVATEAERIAKNEAEARRVTEEKTRTSRDLAARLDRRATELAAAVEDLRTRATAVEGERANLTPILSATQKASEQAAAQRLTLDQQRREWDASTAALARLEAERTAFARRREEFDRRRAEVAQISHWLDELQSDVVEWGLLARAFGKEGLQVLEIDAAGPTVSAFCNDLLHTCFGSRFSVELVTQEAKASKGKDGSTMKEAFELKVFDAERGGEARDLADLSGGEQVLVDEALKSAIALLVNTRNEQPMRTAWRDETTGALDPENARRYLAMLRRVQQLGQFHHVWFVSHDPDEAAQADAQLLVAKGTVRLMLPPYVSDVAA